MATAVVPSTLKLEQQQQGVRQQQQQQQQQPQTFAIQTPTNGGVKNIALAQSFTPPKLENLIQPRGGGSGSGGGGGGGLMAGTQMSEAGPIRNHSVGGRQGTRDRPSPISIDGEARFVFSYHNQRSCWVYCMYWC